MSRLSRLKMPLLAVVMLQGFFFAQDVSKSKIAAESPSTSLTAQRKGTPPPPRNQGVARDWPADFRSFIDGALHLFRDGSKEPTIDEFSKTLHIRLTPIPGMTPTQLHHLGMEQFYRAEATWTAEDWPVGDSRARDNNFLAEMKRPESYRPNADLRTYSLALEIDRNRICIDPYTLAIYTGANFSNEHIGSAATAKEYEWGMFDKAKPATYTSSMNFDLSTEPAASTTGTTSTANCIRAITFRSRFKIGKAHHENIHLNAAATRPQLHPYAHAFAACAYGCI